MTEPTQTPTQPPPPPVLSAKGAGRNIRIALAVSVALNLAVAGMVAGIAWHGGPGGRADMMVRDIGFGPFDEALLPEDREALRQSIRERFGDIRSARRQAQQDTTAILSAMKAEPFDPAALSAALDLQADHLGERLKFGSDLIRDYLLGLPQEARRAFADRLEQRMHRGRGEGRDGEEGRDRGKDD